MTVISESAVPSLTEGPYRQVCSSPLPEGAGVEVNSFLPTDNWKLKTLILAGFDLKTSTNLSVPSTLMTKECSAGPNKPQQKWQQYEQYLSL
jgi:hypothetical protein